MSRRLSFLVSAAETATCINYRQKESAKSNVFKAAVEYGNNQDHREASR